MPRPGHVERYVLEARSPDGRRGVAITCGLFEARETPTRAPHAVAEATAVVFDRDRGPTAVKESTPHGGARFEPNAFRAEVAGCRFGVGHAHGALETGSRRVAWDLTFDALAPPLRHTPNLAMPFPDVRVSGRLEVNGEPLSLLGWPGAVCHSWGTRHAHESARAHANAWDEGDELMVDAVSTRGVLPLGSRGVVSPRLTTVIAVRYRGVRYALHGAFDLPRNRGEISARRYRFEGRSAQLDLAGELWAETDDFVGVYAENPSGPPSHRLATQLARARVEVTLRGGTPAIYHARSAALELGTMSSDHGVRMYL